MHRCLVFYYTNACLEFSIVDPQASNLVYHEYCYDVTYRSMPISGKGWYKKL